MLSTKRRQNKWNVVLKQETEYRVVNVLGVLNQKLNIEGYQFATMKKECEIAAITDFVLRRVEISFGANYIFLKNSFVKV